MFLIKKEISQDKIKSHLSTYQTNGLTMKKYIYLIHQKECWSQSSQPKDCSFALQCSTIKRFNVRGERQGMAIKRKRSKTTAMDMSYISILKSWHWLFHVNNISASKCSISRNPYRTLELSTWGWSLGGRAVLSHLCHKIFSLVAPRWALILNRQSLLSPARQSWGPGDQSSNPPSQFAILFCQN